MLKKDGSLFHIDFGFIFDKEPNFKGWAPKIKINRDMYELIEKEKRSEEFLKECTVMFEGIRCNYRFFIALTVLWNDSHMECVSDSFMHLRNMFNKFSPKIGRVRGLWLHSSRGLGEHVSQSLRNILTSSETRWFLDSPNCLGNCIVG